jgi:beta-D-xylosidase 4
VLCARVRTPSDGVLLELIHTSDCAHVTLAHPNIEPSNRVDNSINGVPTCANSMLNTVLRENWGFDGYITSDSGAIEDIYSAHHYAKNASDATAKAIHDGGCDIDSGGVYHNGLLDAVQEGLLSRADMILSLHRTLKLRFRLGLFDPIEDQPYWAVPIDVVGSDAHQATNLLATLETMVLLKNDGNVLPISPTAKVALIGPHANATEALVGNYLGQLCKGGLSDFSCVQSVASGIAAEFSALTVTPGCTITKEIDGGVAAAVAAAKDADVVILAIGIDGALEGESHDRTDTALPTPQQALAAAIAATGKPTVVVLINGGMVNLEAIKADHAAILSTGYPGYFGAKAIASTLVGDNDHLGGKLPYTVYPADYIQSVKMSDMSMRPSANSPGRSYRWYTGQPVFPFGTGMSLTTFKVTNTSSFCGGSNAVEIADGLATMSYEVTVTNTGTRAGDEVIFGFFTPPQSSVMRQIFGFQRVHLEPGASETVVINATAASFAVAADNGDLVTEHGLLPHCTLASHPLPHSSCIRLINTTYTACTAGPYQITLSNGMLEEVKCAVTFSEGAKVVAPFPGHQM